MRASSRLRACYRPDFQVLHHEEVARLPTGWYPTKANEFGMEADVGCPGRIGGNLNPRRNETQARCGMGGAWLMR